MDQLLNFKTGPSKDAVRQLQGNLSLLNGRIIELEKETSSSNIEGHLNSLALKKAELDAHLSAEPKPPQPAPQQQSSAAQKIVADLTAAKQQHSVFVTERDSLKTERIALFTKQGKLENVSGKLKNLARHVEQMRNRDNIRT